MFRYLKRSWFYGLLAVIAITSSICFHPNFSLIPFPLSLQISTAKYSQPTEAKATVNQPNVNYRWSNVAIKGMGFVTGIVIHSKAPDLIYARTDVGGIFRWDSSNSQWLPLMDGFSQSYRHYYNIESVALDPLDANVVYAAVGAYLNQDNGEILKSVDQGRHWIATGLKRPNGSSVRMGGNDDWRWAGERLAVDPRNSQVIYFGSRLDGLYKSTDGASSWNQVSSFPKVDSSAGGISFVLAASNSTDSATDSTFRPPILYVGVMGQGIFRSTDASKTWELLVGGPNSRLKPQQAALDSNGDLYITYFDTLDQPHGGIWKYAQGAWQDITPVADKNYTAIAVDPNHPDTVIATEYPLHPAGVYRSTNGGQSWIAINLKVKAEKWWPSWHLYSPTGGIAFDHTDSNRVWLTTGFGVLRTDDITANSPHWLTPMSNLEELVTLTLKSPPLVGGAPLLSGVNDMSGFRHPSLTELPQETYEHGDFGDTTGMDFCEADPNIVVRVGSTPGAGGREDSQVRAAYSANNGRTWQSFAGVPPGAVNGKIAVSATLQSNGKPILVWTPQGDVYPHRSLDGGVHWLPVKGAPNRTTLQLWFSSQAIASDRVDGNTFYLYKYQDNPQGGGFYRSTDGGENWIQTVNNLPDHYLHTVKAAPGMLGEVWLAIQGEQLYRSSNYGSAFIPLAQVEKVINFTFGKPAPHYQHPTVFVSGVIGGVEGLFRSDDATSLSGAGDQATWIKISTQDQALGTVNYLEGDPLTFGRVYVGTGGRGILYGEPLSP